MEQKSVEQIKDEIVLAALDHVVFDGWSWKTLCRGAEDAGYNEQKLRAVFPSKLESALDHFSDMADRWMMEKLSALEPADMRIRDRIRHGVLTRIHVLEPYKEAVHASISYWSVPPRQARAGKMTWRTADLIWNWAGDTSKDYNHYTKRCLLSGIVASTIFVWCQNDDPELKRTTDFLDARIGNVMDFGRIIGKLKNNIFCRKNA